MLAVLLDVDSFTTNRDDHSPWWGMNMLTGLSIVNYLYVDHRFGDDEDREFFNGFIVSPGLELGFNYRR